MFTVVPCCVVILCITFFFMCFHVHICNADILICNPANYTKLESNLNIVLNNLVNHINSSSNGFTASVSGQSPDTAAYGFLHCQGDTTVDECYSCALKASTEIRHGCGNATGGISVPGKCFMRYENYSFVGKLDISWTNVLYNTGYATDPDVFTTAVRGLFTNLSEQAYASANRYSSGTTIDSSLQKIFGLVQCWRDLPSIDDCKSCLSTAISSLLQKTVTDNGTHLGGIAVLRSCIARYETYPFFNSAPPPPPPPLQLPTAPPTQQPPLSSPTPKKSSNKIAIVSGIFGGLLAMLLLFLFAILIKYKSRVFGKSLVLAKGNRGIDLGSLMGQPERIIFNLEILRAATRNFHIDNKLGEGGFGPVYKGTLPDGKQIAVKKLSMQSHQGKDEFLNEVKLVAKIQHRNLVNLLGCCVEGSERLLVYDFLPNKSLDKILFHPQQNKDLEWLKRLNIIRGVARGLLYLHEDSQVRIIHRDIKTNNILLDEKMEPKISDFGLARLLGQDETHVNTQIAGTFGYMAPEYVVHGKLSVKADVYSFGVVLLEIICGKKNSDPNLSPEFQSLLELVWRYYRRGNIVDVIDRSIIESCHKEHVSTCVHVGLLCAQADASLRPPMSSIYAMLSNLSTSHLPIPTKPSSVIVSHNNVPSHKNACTSSSENSIVISSSTSSAAPFVYPSINDVSVTECEAR